MIHFPHEIFVKKIIYFIILCLTYHTYYFDSEWTHGTFKGKEVLDGHSIV